MDWREVRRGVIWVVRVEFVVVEREVRKAVRAVVADWEVGEGRGGGWEEGAVVVVRAVVVFDGGGRGAGGEGRLWEGVWEVEGEVEGWVAGEGFEVVVAIFIRSWNGLYRRWMCVGFVKGKSY